MSSMLAQPVLDITIIFFCVGSIACTELIVDLPVQPTCVCLTGLDVLPWAPLYE